MTEIIEIGEDFDRWQELLALIMSSFAYMDGVIDPPSSAHRLTLDNLSEKARAEIAFVAVDEGELLGCLFCRPEPPACLYVGKLCVSPQAQGKGIGKMLLQRSEALARELALPALRLETRIELIGNHARFAAWGFVKTAENAHAGYDRTTSIEMTKVLG
ncbi:GNAT family N-acetyltransferase [Agrobacterium tumefaciens]|uniref:GNAT family N-acetyltransferase n=1 Tax=Agrobacterium tumefaciens TaxID=358 RepID=UPI000DCF8C97|nr:GNAT family N-acetyltransferase [Agrobacterium tumefaciens]MCW8058639.1 GNAT family N-acetyltransferase [Agrobacterium tumefaciens]MCW8142814.1 GNAT family N-acetyltransferase [Agrobacterium tumefaciens]MDP9787286.1 putative N-acetyltransferase YhbS [Agrobacterium tumefaciens]MDP9852847.1 putative N-acetyltransferase YhbS [Agrobacterium tumefaciens]MQB35222.1 GNAT family N-acetyltransferase [Agrobacterium tumefaciens]